MGNCLGRNNLPEVVHLNGIEAFPFDGIRLSYILNEFVARCGGREALKGKTTTEVINEFIKFLTEECQLSFCQMLKREEKKQAKKNNKGKNKTKSPSNVGTPQAFISHAWKYLFLDTLDALENHFKDNLDVFIWFDLFAINQHKASDLPSEWLRTFFKDAIESFGHTVMVLSPWDDPVPYTRAWCVLEAFYTYDTESKFEVAMSETEHRNFIEKALKDAEGTVKKMQATINAEKSTSFLPEDQDKIHNMIREVVGFGKINGLLFDQLRNWIIQVAKQELEMNRDETRRPLLLRMLGLLYVEQGKYVDAQPLLEEAYRMHKIALGSDDEETLKSMSRLPHLYHRQGKYDKALALYLECLDKQKTALGDDHPDTLQTMHNIAVVYQNQGKYDEALALSLECLDKGKAALGDDHPDTLSTMHNIAVVYENQGKYDEALALYLECQDKGKAALGDDHPFTLSTMHNIALVYDNQGKYDEALALYLECLDKRKAALGDDHPDTLSTMRNIALVYENQGKYDEALALSLECLDKQKTALGDDHPDTLFTMHNIAVVYDNQGKYDEALALYLECLDKRKAALGDDHPNTLRTMYNLGLFYYNQGNYDESLLLVQECTDKYNVAFGSNHPESQNALRLLALVKQALQK